MDEEVLLSPVSKFEKYINSTTLNNNDQAWLASWNRWNVLIKVNTPQVIPVIRVAHYIGFMNGAISVLKGELK